MGLTTPSNNYLWGIAKHASGELVIPTTELYAMPVYSGSSFAVQSTNRIEVTDAAAIVGDPYKSGDIHWECNVEVPAFAAPLGALLKAVWPTDTITGAGPYTHTYSGSGTTTLWHTTFATDILGGSVEQVFEAGQSSGIVFSSTEEGGPMHVTFNAVGKRPTIASYTNATPAVLGDGYFTATGAVIQYEVDSATPVTETNVRNFSVTVDRPVEFQPTVDSQSVNYLSIGKLEPNLTMTLLMDDWEAHRATFFGAVAGSTPSSTIVTGSVILNFVHTVTGTWSFQLKIDKVALQAEPPTPDPSGSPLEVTINGLIMKPTAGDHVKPILVNAVASAY